MSDAGRQEPLTLEQAERIISAIRDVAARDDVVLIGGQAVAFWAARLRGGLAEEERALVATSKDLDFQGNRDRLTEAAAMLRARVVLPHDAHRTTFVGVARFLDADRIERAIDFLARPYGMDPADVRTTAIPVAITTDGGERLPLRIMHPQRCMESRVHNSRLPQKQTPLAYAQLRVAIACAAAFARLLLDDKEDRARDVLALNERTFRMACRHADARRLATDHGIDIFDAVVVDDRLGPFVDRRYPQMLEQWRRQREADLSRKSARGNE